MIVNTINTKEQQLKNGYFETGSGSEKILIIGSCRSVPYVQYFHDWNEANGNRFTIRFIDPFNWNYDLDNNRIDMEVKIDSLETNETILSMLAETDIFIHEHYQNFGMFNTFKSQVVYSIYDFGLNPKTDICIPSWNDKFVLVGDIVAFDMDIRKKAIQDYNVTGKLSDQTLKEIYAIRDANLAKFFEICRLSDIEDFAEDFSHNLRRFRFWHNSNHVSKWFTKLVFDDIIVKLEMYASKEFLDYVLKNDMYANIFTPLTEYDQFNWDEPKVKLKSLLF